MGLDFYIAKGSEAERGYDDEREEGTYDGQYAHWSYGGFSQFRTYIALVEGIDLPSMQGYGGARPWNRAEPLTPLLNHSDCEGELTPAECAQVLPKFREILMRIDWGDPFAPDKQACDLFGDMLQHCALTGEYLIFC